ncbi:restriction endonuclease subunit S [Halomonas litopenaei]|nr:restriction endonuclease subunit S [Halomonas litopenaei]
MTFPKYPEYKDSGVEWLGEVPSHWTVVALKWLSPVLRGSSPRPIDDPVYFDESGEYGWVRIADVTASYDGYLKKTTQRLSTLGASLSVKLEPNSLFLSIAGSVGKPCITKIKACIHDGFVYFPWLGDRQRLLYRVFESNLCFGGLGKLGTQLNLNTDTVGGIYVAVPPEGELEIILAFLDHETARIDALVEEQQRLIALLKEKRQAVISHAVTKGLDPDVPMKDSGVEWLGEVPAPWNTPRLKHVADAQGGSTPSKEREDYWLGDIPWVSPKDMKRDVITRTIDNVSEEAVGDNGLKIIPCRSVLVVVRGMILAHTFPVALSGVDVTINQDIKAIISDCERLLPEYLVLLLRGIDEVIFDCIDSSAHGTKKLQWEEFFNTQVPLPSLVEQLRISSEVQAELDQLEQLTSQAQLMARTLSERRFALISAAVTGKIDVRGWQPPEGSTAFTEATQTETV